MFELAKVNDVFADFQEQIKEAKKLNEQTVFDYEDKKGNKEARSHIYKLRQSVSAIEKVRKAEKADSLAYGKEIDSVAKSLAGELREMISVHEEPIKAIEEREKQRIELIKENINFFTFYTQDENTQKPLFEIKLILDSVNEKEINESFGEFVETAELAKFKAVDFLTKKITQIEKTEREEQKRVEEQKKREEQERIENETKAKAEQVEREKQIAIEAKEQAEREAKQREHNAEQQRIAELERVEREKRELIEIAKQNTIKMKRIAEEEKQQAIREEQQRVANENARVEAEKKLSADKESKRQANRAHQGRINNTVLEYLKQLGCDESLGKNIIKSMVKNEIPNVTINY